MEIIFDRFPTLSDDIVESLDEKSLANCVEVNRKWQTTIANQKVYLKKKIRKRSKHSKQFSKEWNMTLVKIPLELLRQLSKYIMDHKYFECDFRFQHPKLVPYLCCCQCLEFSPLHVAALHGNFELFKHIEVKTKNKSPENGDGRTPLHASAYNGCSKVCEIIIKNLGKNKN